MFCWIYYLTIWCGKSKYKKNLNLKRKMYLVNRCLIMLCKIHLNFFFFSSIFYLSRNKSKQLTRQKALFMILSLRWKNSKTNFLKRRWVVTPPPRAATARFFNEYALTIKILKFQVLWIVKFHIWSEFLCVKKKVIHCWTPLSSKGVFKICCINWKGPLVVEKKILPPKITWCPIRIGFLKNFLE